MRPLPASPSPPRPRPRAGAVARAVLAAAALAAAPAHPQTSGAPDFEAGIEWSAAADPAAPWIPRQVAFAGGGEWLWAARAFQTPGATLLGAQEELAGPVLAEEPGWESALGPLATAARGEALYLAGRFDAGGGPRLRVGRRRAALGVPSEDWTVDLAAPGEGGPLLVAGPLGPLLAERAGPGVRLTALDLHDGAPRWSLDLPGGTLRGLALSDDGATAVVLAGARAAIVDAIAGTLVAARTHEPEPLTLALAGDGATLALGFAGRVELWSTAPTASAPLASPTTVPGRIAVALALGGGAPGGELLAVGWWDAGDGRSLALDLWTPTAGGAWTLDQRHELFGAPSALQDYVADVALVGGRAAFGLWGDGTDADPDGRPELVLLERGARAPRLALDLAGSVLGVALDARGERLAVARKDVHANLFGTTGAVELVDTGERDLALDRTPAAGASLTVWLAGEDRAAWVLLGRPGPPLALPPATGTPALDPSGPLLVLPALAPGPGAGPRLSLNLPAAAAGLPFALQGLRLGADGTPAFGATWVHSRVL